MGRFQDMVKKRGQRGKDKATLAREAARELVKKREALKKLKEGEPLGPVEAMKAGNLIREIETLKKKIEGLGFDPVLAASAAAALMIKESLKVPTKGKNLKIKRRRGGVGMYGLGTSVKVWR